MRREWVGFWPSYIPKFPILHSVSKKKGFRKNSKTKTTWKLMIVSPKINDCSRKKGLSLFLTPPDLGEPIFVTPYPPLPEQNKACCDGKWLLLWQRTAFLCTTHTRCSTLESGYSALQSFSKRPFSDTFFFWNVPRNHILDSGTRIQGCKLAWISKLIKLRCVWN